MLEVVQRMKKSIEPSNISYAWRHQPWQEYHSMLPSRPSFDQNDNIDLRIEPLPLGSLMRSMKTKENV
jgi:hypothetical protein